MFTIQQFPFTRAGQASAAVAPHGSNWPVIYLINNRTDIYIGETTSFERRFQEHLQSRKGRSCGYTEIRFAYDGSENKSAILDYESNLIRLFAADGKFSHVQNGNNGQSLDHDFYQRNLYTTNVQLLWDQLHALRLTRQDYRSVRNSCLYKFSPFTSLTAEQRQVMLSVMEDLLATLLSGGRGGSVINGGAGTGKSLLAVKMIDILLNVGRYLSDWRSSPGVYGKDWCSLLSRMERHIKKNGPLRIAYIAPQQSFNSDMEKAFARMPWAGGEELVHNCSNIVTRYGTLEPFDIILVDEAHRLKHRSGMGNDVGQFDENCRRLSLPDGSTQLDLILARTRYCCLFYDPGQSVKRSDITPDELDRSLSSLTRPVLGESLSIQMRCLGGGDYVRFIDDILSGSPAPHPFRGYDFRVWDDAGKMVDEIRRLNRSHGLCRTVAGFAWPWKTRPFIKENQAALAAMGGPNRGKNASNLLALGQYDISVGPYQFVWNIRDRSWVTSPGAADEIGCIHTSQGYDLNYCGLILGPDIRYDKDSGKIEIVPENFCDPFYKRNRRTITPSQLKQYIVNAYRTMFLRGISGCYVYAVDDALRDYLKRCLASASASGAEVPAADAASPSGNGSAKVRAPYGGIKSPGPAAGADPDVWFGKTVASLRKQRGISQEDLAFRSGISRSYMGVIERGEKSPSVDTIARVARGLGMSLSELFSAAGAEA